MTVHADIAIIGTGPGGYVAALRAAQLGAGVVCVEKKWLGGVCLSEGCVPTKALLRSAEVFALARQAHSYGVMVDEPKLDWARAQSRKEQVVQQLVSGVTMLLDRAGVQVLEGDAAFLRPNTLSVRLSERQETNTFWHTFLLTTLSGGLCHILVTWREKQLGRHGYVR